MLVPRHAKREPQAPNINLQLYLLYYIIFRAQYPSRSRPVLTTYQLLFFVPYGWPVHEQFLKDIGYQPPVKSCRIILGSIAKIFAGELVEEARDIMKAKGEAGPIQPRHLVAPLLLPPTVARKE